MELCYIFIENYKNLHRIGFNFSSPFLIEYNHHSRTLTIDRNQNYIKNFFGKNISALTAVIGSNGTGKTKLLEFISQKLQSRYINNIKEDKNIIIFCDDKEKLFYLTEKNIQIKLKYNGIYISDFLTYRAEHPKEIFFCRELIMNRLRENELNEFIRLFYDRENERFCFPPLDLKCSLHLIIGLNFYVQNDIQEISMEEYDDLEEIQDEELDIVQTPDEMKEEEFRKRVRPSSRFEFFDRNCTFPKPNLNVNRFLYAIFVSFIYQFYYKFIYLYKFERERGGKFLEIVSSYLKRDYTSISELVFGIMQDYYGKKDLESKEVLIEKRYFAVFHKIVHYLEENINVTKLAKTSSSIELDLKQDTHNQIESFMLEMKSELEEMNIPSYITFSYEYISFNKQFVASIGKDFSFGETSLLILLAELYYAKEKLETNDNCEHSYVLILDEKDTSLHPQWQKQFVKVICKTIENLYKSNIQIILSSHSPIITSDIPKYCINFIDKDKYRHCKLVSKLRKETFGANIFDLYNDSFFLQDGFIGDFAQDKIKDLVREIESHSGNDAYIEKVINIIGDHNIQKYLKKIWEVSKNRQDVESLTNKIRKLEKEIKLLKNSSNNE